MIEFQFRLDDFERMARQVGGALDQVPFALSMALNNAAENTRHGLIEKTWPSHVTVRKASFLNAALTTKDARATKTNLRVAIYDKLRRGHLGLHATGGVKKARGKFAVPTKAVTRTASGVLASQRPAVLRRKVVKGNLIFQAQGRGKNSKLKLLYKLAPITRQPKDVPFVEDFRASMLAQIRQTFPKAMARAMATRR